MKSYKFFDVYITRKGNVYAIAPTRTASMMIMFKAIGIEAEIIAMMPPKH